MRLICPNCGAQYEVDDSLVPESGRDVQCSNCGHGWFQKPAQREAEVEAAEEVEPEVDDFDDDISAGAEPDDEPPVPPAPPAQRKPLPEDVRSILEEEAGRETAARREESGIETQGDLGLDGGGEARPGLRERMARLRGLDVDERAENTAAAVAAATAAGSRRDLLPDIEEINSSLRSAEERDDAIDAEEVLAPRKRSGFGLGFFLVVLVAVLLAGVYVFADQIVAAVPAAEPAISAYVALADRIRAWLDGMAQDWVRRLSGLVDSIQRTDSAGG